MEYSEKVIERGRTYLKEGRVLSVRQIRLVVFGMVVLGSELYLVDLDGSGKKMIFVPAHWEEHGYCKHTVAVELYLREKGLSGNQARDCLAEKNGEQYFFC